ncbi:hypothetical protein SAMN05421780_101108 [Flexibacter flexilis DSM 6793]|uniref:Uncharacterized protein n=1 Tax=Flexibacter flexilis DSM 6793 TaxID=927664 RepID=A0A1I1DH33_9BACT|nr:hypothetical protein [Flexibacter flexilis]SFB72368.1 hypothetical protein SAMN05421780_101108 [Flexibacter flexilis DSM 6793]
MNFTEEGSLNALILAHQYFTLLEIEGIVDNGSTLRLGHVEIDKYYAGYRVFSHGFSSELTHNSMFRLMPFDVPVVNRSGIAAIFQASIHNEIPEEYFAGWVNQNRKSDLKKWISQMNKYIKKMLKETKTSK